MEYVVPQPRDSVATADKQPRDDNRGAIARVGIRSKVEGGNADATERVPPLYAKHFVSDLLADSRSVDSYFIEDGVAVAVIGFENGFVLDGAVGVFKGKLSRLEGLPGVLL